MKQQKKILDLLPGVKKNIILAPYTTWRIGGLAKYFYVANSNEELIKAINIARQLVIPYFILGGGSNLLIDDCGFVGLVIKIQTSNYRVYHNHIIVDAGIRLSKLIKISLDNNLTGLEWATGIPGTVGGAVRGNAGVMGQSISDILTKITIFSKNKIKTMTVSEAQFSYRQSIFQQHKSKIILSVEVKLKKGNANQSQKVISELLQQRQRKQPLNYPNAGCIFKNPARQSAGQLIDQCGLKGEKIGQAQISLKHANFIVNLGGATSKQVLTLINLIKQTVKDKFAVDLQVEIEFLSTPLLK